MGRIPINSIVFSTPPASPKVVTIKHKLTSDPDVNASYTTDTTTLSVPVNGDISPDFVISGLLDETSYTVKIFTNCGGGSIMQDIVTGVVCPDVTGITGVGAAG